MKTCLRSFKVTTQSTCKKNTESLTHLNCCERKRSLPKCLLAHTQWRYSKKEVIFSSISIALACWLASSTFPVLAHLFGILVFRLTLSPCVCMIDIPKNVQFVIWLSHFSVECSLSVPQSLISPGVIVCGYF
jgi:hypothetical protein